MNSMISKSDQGSLLVVMANLVVGSRGPGVRFVLERDHDKVVIVKIEGVETGRTARNFSCDGARRRHGCAVLN
jgi:hypothetical protein